MRSMLFGVKPTNYSARLIGGEVWERWLFDEVGENLSIVTGVGTYSNPKKPFEVMETDMEGNETIHPYQSLKDVKSFIMQEVYK